MSSKSRIPKAPATVSLGKSDRLQSPLCETKLPTIKNSKVQTIASSSASNCNSTLTLASLGPGTTLRRTNSSLAESTTTKISSAKNETKLRRVNSNLTETKRPKSQILMTATKLPKLHQNPSELKPSKIGSGKLQQLGTGDVFKEAKGRKTPKMTDKSKLPRIQTLSLPLKEINAEISPVEICKESLGNFENMNPSLEQMALTVEPLKSHVTSVPPKVSKTTEDSSKRTQGTEVKASHLKASATVTSTKLPKALPVTNNTLPRSLKIRSTNTKTTPPVKPPTPTTTLERKLSKTQLSLNGLKASKATESKLPKTPTTPDDTKQPKALVTGVAATNSSDMRRQKDTIRR